MNKVIKLLIIINLLSNILYAELSKEKIYQYIDLSAGGVMYSSYYFQLLNKFNYTPSMEDSEKYLYLYFDKLDLLHYEDIITFYSSKVGIKYKKVIADMYDEYNLYDMAKNTKEIFKILHPSKKQCTQNRQKIIDDIEKNLNFMEIRLSFYIKTLYLINHFSTKKKKPIMDDLNVIIDKKKIDFFEYHKIFSCVAYEDFLTEELEYLAKYSTSETAKYEVTLINEGFSSFIKIFIRDLMKSR